MTTDNTDCTPQTSLTVEQAFTVWERAKESVATAQQIEHEALRTIARAAGEKTFEHNGQAYQIREKKESDGSYTPYLCRLKEMPKARKERSSGMSAEEARELQLKRQREALQALREGKDAESVIRSLKQDTSEEADESAAPCPPVAVAPSQEETPEPVVLGAEDKTEDSDVETSEGTVDASSFFTPDEEGDRAPVVLE